MSKRRMFFAAKNDLNDLLVLIEQKIPLKYYPQVIDSPTSRSGIFYESIKDIDGIGYATAKDAPGSSHFIVVDHGSTITYISRNRKNGTEYLTANLNSNADFTYFTPGGIFADCIIAGEISLRTELDFNGRMMRRFGLEIKKSSQKVGSYYVMKDAQIRKSKGSRLTINCSYPKSHDVV